MIAVADEVASADTGRTQVSAIVLPMKAAVLARRGHVAEGESLVAEFLPLARAIGDAQVLVPAIDVAAMVEASRGDAAAGANLLDELAEVGSRRFVSLPEEARVLLAAGRDASALLELPLPRCARVDAARTTVRALLAEAEGDTAGAGALYGEAAQAWESYGHVLERALALLGHGRCARSTGDVRAARRILADLGAVPLVGEADRVLSEQVAAS